MKESLKQIKHAIGEQSGIKLSIVVLWVLLPLILFLLISSKKFFQQMLPPSGSWIVESTLHTTNQAYLIGKKEIICTGSLDLK